MPDATGRFLKHPDDDEITKSGVTLPQRRAKTPLEILIEIQDAYGEVDGVGQAVEKLIELASWTSNIDDTVQSFYKELIEPEFCRTLEAFQSFVISAVTMDKSKRLKLSTEPSHGKTLSDWGRSLTILALHVKSILESSLFEPNTKLYNKTWMVDDTERIEKMRMIYRYYDELFGAYTILYGNDKKGTLLQSLNVAKFKGEGLADYINDMNTNEDAVFLQKVRELTEEQTERYNAAVFLSTLTGP